jgi:hypothetical protein
MAFGRAPEEFARRVEALWQSLMEEYLGFSDTTLHLRAEQSGHYIHLTEPERIGEALAWVDAAAGEQ